MTTVTTETWTLPSGRGLTCADLDSVPDDGWRYELIDGVLIVSPAPRLVHQRVVAGMYRALHAACPPGLEVLFAPLDVVLAEDTKLQPDLLVAPPTSFTDTNLPGAPVLAVEVVSKSTRGVDLLLKKDRLQRAGCAYYWVIDPDEPSILAWALVDGMYREVARATAEQTFGVTEPFAVTLVPASLTA